MKVRMGFVSNSSSSSFVCYGSDVETEAVEKMIKKLFVSDEKFKEKVLEYYDDKSTPIEDIIDEDGVGEVLYDVKLPNGIIVQHCYDGDYVYAGKYYQSMRDDETFGEFKKTVSDTMKELFGDDIECDHVEEVWYN